MFGTWGPEQFEGPKWFASNIRWQKLFRKMFLVRFGRRIEVKNRRLGILLRLLQIGVLLVVSFDMAVGQK